MSCVKVYEDIYDGFLTPKFSFVIKKLKSLLPGPDSDSAKGRIRIHQKCLDPEPN